MNVGRDGWKRLAREMTKSVSEKRLGTDRLVIKAGVQFVIFSFSER
jgi:hypothetical protein